MVQHPETVEATGIREFLSIESLLHAEGKHYMVFSPPLVFSEAQYYSSHPDDCILLLPPDFQQQPDALQSSPDPYLHQRLLLNLSHFYPLQFWRLYNLKAYAQEVALIEPSRTSSMPCSSWRSGPSPFCRAAEGRVFAIGLFFFGFSQSATPPPPIDRPDRCAMRR